MRREYGNNKLSRSLHQSLTQYYRNLYEKKEEKTITEIIEETEICECTLRRYWESVGIHEEVKINSLTQSAKIVLLQTKFFPNSKYYNIRQEFLQIYEKSKRRKEIYEFLKQNIERKKLQDSREQLVKTLEKVYETKKK